MQTKLIPRRRKRKRKQQRTDKSLKRLLESDVPQRLSLEDYKAKVRDVYDGPQGQLLRYASVLSLHMALGERLLRRRKFDLSGARQILDVGSGAGQIAGHLIKFAPPQASITCTDISYQMLRRARRRLEGRLKNGLGSRRPRFVAADITALPFDDGSFDCVTCGYVLEHLPEPQPGLREMARVMAPGARMLLLTSEDSFSGACTSRLWCCRTFNRQELYDDVTSVGLVWQKELWFSRVHKLMRAGGICVELRKPE